MKFRDLVFVGWLLLALPLTAVAQNDAQVPILPDPELSVCWTDYAGGETLSVMALPDGSGDAFDSAMLPDGTRTSGVIRVALLDPLGNPYEGYPNEDIWLGASDDGLAFCAGGNIADQFTDSEGQTFFRAPVLAGGTSQGLLQVSISGVAITSSAGLDIHINSPDLNGDQQVDLIDVVQFTADFYGPYTYRSDFHHDGVINLFDVSRMAQSQGAGCP